MSLAEGVWKDAPQRVIVSYAKGDTPSGATDPEYHGEREMTVGSRADHRPRLNTPVDR